MSYYPPDDIYKRRRAKDPFLKWILICWLVPFGMIYHAITRRTWAVIVFNLIGGIFSNCLVFSAISMMTARGSAASNVGFLDTLPLALGIFGWAFNWLALKWLREGNTLKNYLTMIEEHEESTKPQWQTERDEFINVKKTNLHRRIEDLDEKIISGRVQSRIEESNLQFISDELLMRFREEEITKYEKEKEDESRLNSGNQFEFDKSAGMFVAKEGRPTKSNTESAPRGESSLPTAKLQELKAAFDQGLIDDAEYSALKKQLLGL